MRTCYPNTIKTLVLLPIVAAIVTACSTQPKVMSTPTTTNNVETYNTTSTQSTVISDEDLQNNIVINEQAPKRYVVKKGDTLWDISNMFLRDPWRWPEVWHINPQVKNPHLIYPGDVLMLSYDKNHRPTISLEGQKGDFLSAYPNGILVNGNIKLSPYARRGGGDPISAIPMEKIRPYLRSARIVSKNELKHLPMIVGSLDDHLIVGKGYEVYAKNISEPSESFQILRQGRAFFDPDTQDILGYEAKELGVAKLAQYSENPEHPSTLTITDSNTAILKGDRLVSTNDEEVSLNFMPHEPGFDFNGKIVATHNGSHNVGSTQVVVTNLGANQGFEPGHIVSIHQRGHLSRYQTDDGRDSAQMRMPNVRAALGVVFKTYDDLSYVLVLDATRAISKGDRLAKPVAGVDY